MGVARWDTILEAAQHYIVIRLKSKIPPLSIVLGFNQGEMFRSCQVLEVVIIVKIRLDFQITCPSILIMLVLGNAYKTTPDGADMLNQK